MRVRVQCEVRVVRVGSDGPEFPPETAVEVLSDGRLSSRVVLIVPGAKQPICVVADELIDAIRRASR